VVSLQSEVEDLRARVSELGREASGILKASNLALEAEVAGLQSKLLVSRTHNVDLEADPAGLAV
jgi:hypothetical protein